MSGVQGDMDLRAGAHKDDLGFAGGIPDNVSSPGDAAGAGISLPIEDRQVLAAHHQNCGAVQACDGNPPGLHRFGGVGGT